MRFKLLRRRLTISSPRMAVRSALPWPFRWALLAIVLGFCAAIGLWAFEFGRDIAGLEKGSREEVQHLRQELAQLRTELSNVREDRDRAQRIANTADTLVTAEKASQGKTLEHVKLLEAENRKLRDDLGFFEKLIPSTGAPGVTIRGLQADPIAAGKLKWQVLVLQSAKGGAEFSGRLELSFAGTLAGNAWTGVYQDGPIAIKVRQYGRVEGEYAIPAGVTVKSVTARVLDGNTLLATQSLKL